MSWLIPTICKTSKQSLRKSPFERRMKEKNLLNYILQACWNQNKTNLGYVSRYMKCLHMSWRVQNLRLSSLLIHFPPSLDCYATPTYSELCLSTWHFHFLRNCFALFYILIKFYCTSILCLFLSDHKLLTVSRRTPRFFNIYERIDIIL